MEGQQLTGLSRRAFLAATAGLAASGGLSRSDLFEAAARQAPAGGNTLRQTTKLGSATEGSWQPLGVGVGDPHVQRTDLLSSGKEVTVADRRSLFYFGHLSDIHIIDAQSPGRLEPLVDLSKSFVDATRAHETMTIPVLAAMVASVRNLVNSPVTGAPMALAVNTGDSADSMSNLELRWCIDILDGKEVTPNSGGDSYQGVQAWGNDYAYQPGDPRFNKYGEYGFPRLPDMLQNAISRKVSSPGLPVPWYTLYGNNDTLWMGNVDPGNAVEAWTVGSQKANEWPATAELLVDGWAANATAVTRLVQEGLNKITIGTGVHEVSPDPEREMFTQRRFMEEHLDSPALPGPVGHGFTQEHVSSGQTYWRLDPTPYLTFLGLNTCNQIAGADGAVPKSQFDWLIAQLEQARSEDRLAIVCSHHNSHTLDNGAESAVAPDEPLVHSEELVVALLEHRNLIAWVNGHTHINSIIAHQREEGGFWEITSASCIDFPQQQQVIEVVDNRDGTLSIFATTLDHDSPASWQEGDWSQRGLASLSRTLAANSWEFNPGKHLGSLLDRNTELLLPAPFDLSKISEQQVETHELSARARLVAAT